MEGSIQGHDLDRVEDFAGAGGLLLVEAMVPKIIETIEEFPAADAICHEAIAILVIRQLRAHFRDG